MKAINKTEKRIIISLLSIVLVAGGIALGMNLNKPKADTPVIQGLETGAQDYTGDKDTYTGEQNTDTISIPGFDVMNIKADTTEQSVNLYNPEENICYFKMSIFLNDGTLLWESQLIEPGKGVYDITLTQTLSVGAYEDCILKYETFTMDENQSPLNGAETKFTLNVLE